MKTLVLANQKGGVGKTAVATLLAHYLRSSAAGTDGNSRPPMRVLAIDLDHQGNLTRPLKASGRVTVAPVTADQLLSGFAGSLPAAPFVLVPSDRALLGLERQPDQHTPFLRHLRAFLARMDDAFDVCIVDTNPNPDIRVIAALACADHVLSPILLTMEALDGVNALLNHERVGIRKIKAVLNPKLNLIGLLPTMVEATPFQRTNLVQIVERFYPLLIPLQDGSGRFASLPRRSSVAEAQAHGELLWEMKKSAAREAWREMEPSLRRIAAIVTEGIAAAGPSEAAAPRPAEEPRRDVAAG
jgi:chromosome partitioning protein